MIAYTGKLEKKYRNIVEVTPEELEQLDSAFELVVVDDGDPLSIKANIPVLYLASKDMGLTPYPYIVKQDINIECIFELLDKGEIPEVLNQAYNKIGDVLNIANLKSLNNLKVFLYEALKQQNMVTSFMEGYMAQFNGEMDRLVETNLSLEKQVDKLSKLNQSMEAKLKDMTDELKNLKTDIKSTVDTSVREGIAVNIPKITDSFQHMSTYDINKTVKNKIFYFKDYGCAFLTSFCFAYRKYLVSKLGGPKVKLLIVAKDDRYRRRDIVEYTEVGAMPDVCLKVNPTNSFWENYIRRLEHGFVYIVVDKTNYPDVLIKGSHVSTFYGIKSSLDHVYFNTPIQNTIRACYTSDEKVIKTSDLKALYVIPFISDYMEKPPEVQYAMYLKAMKPVFEGILSTAGKV